MARRKRGATADPSKIPTRPGICPVDIAVVLRGDDRPDDDHIKDCPICGRFYGRIVPVIAAAEPELRRILAEDLDNADGPCYSDPRAENEIG